MPISFIGDFSCKVDEKGRIMLPAALVKQMAASADGRFVVKKDIFEKCLILYPMEEWQRQNEIIREKMNPYSRDHNQFLREFHRGIAEVAPDNTNRILIPKRLLEMVDIGKEAVLAGMDGKIELWAKDLYEQNQVSDNDFAHLAEKIMGNTP